MSAQFYVKDAQRKVAQIRQRLVAADLCQDLDSALDVESFATLAGDCSIVSLPALSERSGLEYLSRTYGLNLRDHQPGRLPLAGALCVADGASLRWILVRAEDSARRRRFTVAHELGHLFLEVEPLTHKDTQSALALEVESAESRSVQVFSRCSMIDEAPKAETSRRVPLSNAELLEVKADHFASELLMPYEGIKRLIQKIASNQGIRTAEELHTIVQAVSAQYDVSLAAARRRLEKDLAVVPLGNHPNRDLFT